MEEPCLVTSLFAKVIDKPEIYHCKAHGEHVSKAACLLGKLLGFSDKDVLVLRASGLWHDVGMILDDCKESDKHEEAGADHLRHLCDGDSFCLRVADTIMEAPKVVVAETAETKGNKLTLPRLLSIADYIAQCANPCYLLMLGKLFETFDRAKKARGYDENRFRTKTELLYDDFIENVIYPAVRPYLELQGMEENRRGFELNMQIRRVAREKGITYEQLAERIRKEAGIEGDELNWNLPVTLEVLEALLQRMQ